MYNKVKAVATKFVLCSFFKKKFPAYLRTVAFVINKTIMKQQNVLVYFGFWESDEHKQCVYLKKDTMCNG